MLRLLTDENLDRRILRGLRQRVPELDCVFVQQAGMAGSSDEQLLEWPDRLEIGRAIEGLEVIIECASESDLKDRIYYLPL